MVAPVVVKHCCLPWPPDNSPPLPLKTLGTLGIILRHTRYTEDSAVDFSPNLVRGSVVPVVLALLDERPMYGYEIVKIVNVRTNGRLEWKEGTVYPRFTVSRGNGSCAQSGWIREPQRTAAGAVRPHANTTASHARAARNWSAIVNSGPSFPMP